MCRPNTTETKKSSSKTTIILELRVGYKVEKKSIYINKIPTSAGANGLQIVILFYFILY